MATLSNFIFADTSSITKKSYTSYGPYKHHKEALYKRSTGRWIEIKSMDNVHLFNAIEKMERNFGVEAAHRDITYRNLVAEAIYRNIAVGEIESSEWDNEENK